jgi:hypothetical protein
MNHYSRFTCKSGWILQVYVISLLVQLSACSTPRMEGPNISDPPAGFVYDANASNGRNIFATEDILRQAAWIRPREEHFCDISMTEYTGSATRQDVQEALDYFIKKYSYPTYGPLETITIDGHDAWGWQETQFYKGEQSSMTYRAVVSYEDRCWAIEFYAKDPAWQNTERMKEIICSFERD